MFFGDGSMDMMTRESVTVSCGALLYLALLHPRPDLGLTWLDGYDTSNTISNYLMGDVCWLNGNVQPTNQRVCFIELDALTYQRRIAKAKGRKAIIILYPSVLYILASGASWGFPSVYLCHES